MHSPNSSEITVSAFMIRSSLEKLDMPVINQSFDRSSVSESLESDYDY